MTARADLYCSGIALDVEIAGTGGGERLGVLILGHDVPPVCHITDKELARLHTLCWPDLGVEFGPVGIIGTPPERHPGVEPLPGWLEPMPDPPVELHKRRPNWAGATLRIHTLDGRHHAWRVCGRCEHDCWLLAWPD